MQTKFIVVDGVDRCGKSTFISQLKANPEFNGKLVELNFPKLLPSGTLLRINDEKAFELLFSVFQYLDPAYTYVLDRFIPSNLVYDKVLRNEDVSVSKYYWAEFQRRFDVFTLFFTRPEIQTDFADDKISMPKDTFNACIREYHNYGINHMLLQCDETGEIQSVDEGLRDWLVGAVSSFVDGSNV